MTTNPSTAFKARAKEADDVLRAIQLAVRETLIDHKQSGNSVVFCDGAEIRWVPAEEIEIPVLHDAT